MRTVIQCVSHASVTINGVVKSAIEGGLLVLVGVEDADTEEDIQWLSKKIHIFLRKVSGELRRNKNEKSLP